MLTPIGIHSGSHSALRSNLGSNVKCNGTIQILGVSTSTVTAAESTISLTWQQTSFSYFGSVKSDSRLFVSFVVYVLNAA